MRSALLVASELLAHRPWGWFDIDAKERLYDYAARDFETASRHWSALDTKASQLMAADAVLLGLVVGGAQTFLPTPTAAMGWTVTITLLFFAAVGMLVTSFLCALAAWRLRTVETLPAAMDVILTYQKEMWTARRTVETLAFRTAQAAKAHMEEAQEKSRHLRRSTGFLAVGVILIVFLALVPAMLYVGGMGE